MGFLSRVMDLFRLSPDEEDDGYFGDSDDEYGLADQPARKGFLSRGSEDDYDDGLEDSKPRLFGRSSKVVPMRRGMEVSLVKPTDFDDAQEICDYLLAGKAVVLNMEGMHTDVAQRIIDFVSGAAYSINGNLQKISNYIFIVTPDSVGLSGDFPGLVETGSLDAPGLNIRL